MKSQHPCIFLAKSICLATFLLLFVSAGFAANKVKVIYNYTGGSDGGDPATSLSFDSKGNLYGTTVVGGVGYGAIFKLSPTKSGGWKETVLYSFTGGGDGKNPYGGVILDKSGNLYGTTVAGGSGGVCAGDGCGVVYELANKHGSYELSVLYNFTGGNDGFGPGNGLVFDSKGNLYGSTPDGGKDQVGVVYALIHGKGGWTQKVIHTFTGGNDGSTGSLGSLMFDSAGNLYGVAELGGAHQAGTAFKMTPSSGGKWKFTTIYAFPGMPKAGSPYGGLISDTSGNLYGTTYYGGKNGAGSVYELVNSGNGHYAGKVLYSFQTAKDVNSPLSTLTFDASGNLYGTATQGGDAGCGCGGIFKLAASGGKWKESVAHPFKGDPDGNSPNYGVVIDGSGNLYGATVVGGNKNQGAIFKLTP
jgi:uncharacterized repeat protein (TIGR03803 family)